MAIFQKNYPELREDWTYILEVLNGMHPIGWTFTPHMKQQSIWTDVSASVKDLIQFLKDRPDTSIATTSFLEKELGELGAFIAPIVNRTLRLGIGKSLLSRTKVTPMLAKKYEGGRLGTEYYITEKLDGNRCIASFDGEKWNFTSRSGKPMNVDFDMFNFSSNYVYDGEVMSLGQTEESTARYNALISKNDLPKEQYVTDRAIKFNEASGLINKQGPKKGLVYNIFDIILDRPYEYRRTLLDTMTASKDTRVVPVLYHGKDIDDISHLLDFIVNAGGEGVMLNHPHRHYEQKRSDALLKYKQVQTMDMKVTGVFEGKGKYEGMCGGIECYTPTDDGRQITCDVGSGLSDAQREEWWDDPEQIVGKIVEIAYHELTQDRHNIGTRFYSVRFPRLKGIRDDKITTSEY